MAGNTRKSKNAAAEIAPQRLFFKEGVVKSLPLEGKVPQCAHWGG